MPPGSNSSTRAASDAALASFAPVTRTDKPVWETTLWPNRSLSPSGFRWLMLIAALGFSLPVLPFVFAGAGWILLPFALGAFALLGFAFGLNNKQARLREHIALWPDLIAIERHETNGTILRWQANPYWVRFRLLESGGPVDNYLILIGADREIELGAFLSPEERLTLLAEIKSHIKNARNPLC